MSIEHPLVSKTETSIIKHVYFAALFVAIAASTDGWLPLFSIFVLGFCFFFFYKVDKESGEDEFR